MVLVPDEVISKQLRTQQGIVIRLCDAARYRIIRKRYLTKST